ncbi:hypothetical protein [Streptococcus oralis]|uniref:Metal-binding protein n=1 Tax=Streptococcus oralis TaxID=1303 RepID=A0A139QSX1_STROR|nr:hypothetical protein [Streptococcus oralis]KXU05649.1 hypothetical protein SORDD24_00499 [Streptococcus oralis]
MINFRDYFSIFNRKQYPNFKSFSEDILLDETGPCLCLSGKIFNDCCRKKREEAFSLPEIERKKRLSEFYQLFLYEKDHHIAPPSNSVIFEKESRGKKKRIKYCTAKKVYSKDCEDLIKNAHTLSRGNNFKSLTDENSVYTFNEHVPIIFWNIDKIDSCYINQKVENQASAYPMYCDKHDTLIFKEIEQAGKSPFKNTYIENIEYAIKSCSFELYYKVLNLKYLANMFEQEPLVSDNSFIDHYFLTQKSMFETNKVSNKLLDLHKRYSRKEYKFKKFKTVVIDIPSKKIECILSEMMEVDGINVFINMINCPLPRIIISWYDNGQVYNRDWEEWVNLILMNSTNIFFSNQFISGLDQYEKTYLFLNHRRTPELSQEQQNFLKINDKLLKGIINKLCNLAPF